MLLPQVDLCFRRLDTNIDNLRHLQIEGNSTSATTLEPYRKVLMVGPYADQIQIYSDRPK